MSVDLISTVRLYYVDSTIYESTATVLRSGKGADGSKYIVTNQTIFHPQGGGQPDDYGFIRVNGKNFPVIRLLEEDSTIQHFYEGDETIEAETTVSLAVDSAR